MPPSHDLYPPQLHSFKQRQHHVHGRACHRARQCEALTESGVVTFKPASTPKIEKIYRWKRSNYNKEPTRTQSSGFLSTGRL
jgi:hypothetical protein